MRKNSPKKNNSRILIVDDEPDITLSLKKALVDNGFERVATFNDPLIALRNFKADLYNLLILDSVMPQMDGFELCREIKEIDNYVKVCFITAFEVNYQALRMLFPNAATTDDIGCFIRKPIEGKALVKHVEEEQN
jgi:DNA-binding response OmpR family regulator